MPRGKTAEHAEAEASHAAAQRLPRAVSGVTMVLSRFGARADTAVQRAAIVPSEVGVGVSGGVPNRRAGGQGSSSGSFISFNGGFACKATDGGRRGGRLLATVLGAKGRNTLCDISQSSFRRFSSEQVNSYPLSHPTTTTTTTSLTHNLPAPHHDVRRQCSYHHYCCWSAFKFWNLQVP